MENPTKVTDDDIKVIAERVIHSPRSYWDGQHSEATDAIYLAEWILDRLEKDDEKE